MTDLFALLDQRLTELAGILKLTAMHEGPMAGKSLNEHLAACPAEQRLAIEQALRMYVYGNIFPNASDAVKLKNRQALKDTLVETVGKGVLGSVDDVETVLIKFDAMANHWRPKTPARAGAAR